MVNLAAIHALGICHHPVLGDRCCCSSFLGSMVVGWLVGTVYGAKSGNDQDLSPLLLLGKWLSLPPLMVQPAATLLREHSRDQKDFSGKSHPLSTCCFQQFGHSIYAKQRQIFLPSIRLKIVALGSEFDRKLPHNLCPWLRSSHCNCQPCSAGRSK